MQVAGRGLRRVVVTGTGLVTPLGCGRGDKIFSRVMEGVVGVHPVPTDMNHPAAIPLNPTLGVQALARVPSSSFADYFQGLDSTLTSDLLFQETRTKSIERETSKFIRFAVHAAFDALVDANIISDASSQADFVSIVSALHAAYDPSRCGAAIGNGGIGSLPEILSSSKALETSPRKLSPYFVPKILANMAAGHVSIQFGLQGPVHCTTTACAAGSHAIGDAFNMIRMGYADFMLAGGADASIDPLSIGGFARMKALSTPSEQFRGTDDDESAMVTRSSRPFDSARNGFVMGEGAGVMVLESLESALERGAPIIAEIVGYGLSGDAYHLTSPPPDGSGALRSMRMAIADAGIEGADVGYVNAHATSTPLGDAIEVNAVRSLLTNTPAGADAEIVSEAATKILSIPRYISSTKGATGHLLGAAGAVEAAFTALAVKHQAIPPTANLDNIEAGLEGGGLFSHVPKQGVAYSTDGPLLEYALNNSFGFGGTNASLIFRRFQK